jgi:hypothetical protein
MLDPELIFLLRDRGGALAGTFPGTHMSIFDAAEKSAEQAIIIYPNFDAGGDQIIAEIESRLFAKEIMTFWNLPRRVFDADIHRPNVLRMIDAGCRCPTRD